MTTDWESRYRNGDTPWCKGRPHPMLSPMIDRLLPAVFAGRVLVPGCGRGWDLAAIATARPAATVIGIDVSQAALNDVAGHVRDHPRIELVFGDFLDAAWLNGAVGKVDFLWEHTCFCAIDPSTRTDYVASAAAVLKPGALLAGVFFVDLDDEGHGPPWNCPQPQLESHFSASFDVEHCELARDTFEGRHAEEYEVRMRRRAE